MTTTQTDTTQTGRGFFASLGESLLALIEAVGSASHAGRCAREAERLFALSDAELARRGLTRDRVIPHAFGPYFHL